MAVSSGAAGMMDALAFDEVEDAPVEAVVSGIVLSESPSFVCTTYGAQNAAELHIKVNAGGVVVERDFSTGEVKTGAICTCGVCLCALMAVLSLVCLLFSSGLAYHPIQALMRMQTRQINSHARHSEREWQRGTPEVSTSQQSNPGLEDIFPLQANSSFPVLADGLGHLPNLPIWMPTGGAEINTTNSLNFGNWNPDALLLGQKLDALENRRILSSAARSGQKASLRGSTRPWESSPSKDLSQTESVFLVRLSPTDRSQTNRLLSSQQFLE